MAIELEGVTWHWEDDDYISDAWNTYWRAWTGAKVGAIMHGLEDGDSPGTIDSVLLWVTGGESDRFEGDPRMFGENLWGSESFGDLIDIGGAKVNTLITFHIEVWRFATIGDLYYYHWGGTGELVFEYEETMRAPVKLGEKVVKTQIVLNGNKLRVDESHEDGTVTGEWLTGWKKGSTERIRPAAIVR